jgi:hypothetical protein
MNASTVLAAIFLGCLTLILVIWYLNGQHKMQMLLLEKQQSHTYQLMDKLIAAAVAKDPMAFQAIQAMSSSTFPEAEVDPSDFGEYERLVEQGRLDQIDDAALQSLGIGPEHFGIG